MFNVERVSNKIRQARIEKNMTQMNLADEMGVSYQAVSNWERGNSVPDIGKMQHLCEVLDLDLEELLGKEPSTEKIRRIVERPEAAEELTTRELLDMAPVLPPKALTHAKLEEKELDGRVIAELAPFLPEKTLGRLAERYIAEENLSELAKIAPFLSKETLDRLADQCIAEGNQSKLVKVAPFLAKKTLDRLAERYIAEGNQSELVKVAPFLSKETLDRLC